jgi:hypothetical protein
MQVERANRGEKMKSKFKVLAAAAVVGLMGLGNSAHADFTINTQTFQGTGTLTGYTIVRFLAFNDGNNGTGQKLVAVDVQLDTDASTGFKFRAYDADGDNEPDVDVALTGSGASFASTSDATKVGTAIRPFLGGLGNGQYVIGNGVSPAHSSSEPVTDPNTFEQTPTQFPFSTTYANVKSFRVPFSQAGGDFSPNANTGSGTPFAVAIVPTGSTTFVKISPGPNGGGVAGESGGFVSFAPVTVPVGVPEPTSLSLLGLGGAALLGRRRRR